MAAATTRTTTPKDEADRAVAELDRALARLIGLLASDDAAASARALAGLLRFGTAATARLLIHQLARGVEGVSLRLRIVEALEIVGLDPAVRCPVILTMLRLLTEDPSPFVSAQAASCLVALRLTPEEKMQMGVGPGADVPVPSDAAGGEAGELPREGR